MAKPLRSLPNPTHRWTDGDPKQFEKDGCYEFPFELFDSTPGGSNLGRIEWMLETSFTGRNITGLILSAKQTRDPRYDGKLFHLKCKAPLLTSVTFSAGRRSFFESVWAFGQCEIHKLPILIAYPPDGTSKLCTDSLYSGVSTAIWWE